MGPWRGGGGHINVQLLLFAQDFQAELDSYQATFDSANTSGQRLTGGVLDDPAITRQALQDAGEKWEELCQCSMKKQEMLDIALEVMCMCRVWCVSMCSV